MKKKENPFEEYKKEEIKEINKSDIFDAMCEPVFEGSLSVEKTGKQIKDQVSNVIVPKLKLNYEEIISKLNNLLTLTGKSPTMPIRYYKIKLDLPYKEYDWSETQYHETTEEINGIFDTFANSDDIGTEESTPEIIFEKNPALTQEQAQARCSYNENLRILREIAVDIKTAQVLLQFEDSKVYKLNINQSIALGF